MLQTDIVSIDSIFVRRAIDWLLANPSAASGQSAAADEVRSCGFSKCLESAAGEAQSAFAADGI
jgi:hypothetical protein